MADSKSRWRDSNPELEEKIEKKPTQRIDHSPYSEQKTHFEFEPERKLRGTLKKNDKMSENESLDTENDTFEGGESREIANTTTTLATTTLLNSQQVDSRIFGYSRVNSGNGECVEPCCYF